MSRRIAGLVAAVLFALVGTAALVAYVGSAEQRALAGERLVEVYLVVAPIAAGTPAEEIEPLVAVERVPVKAVAQGAVDSLTSLTGQVTAVDLFPGEQLVAGRFVQRSELADRELGIDVPDDMMEITVELDPQRATGGLLEAGQTVAVLASFSPIELTETVIPVDGEAIAVPAAAAVGTGADLPSTTDLLLRKVLVTAVQRREGPPPDDDRRLTTAPEGTVFVTLAVSPFDAERVVYSAEFGRLWLALERETVPEGDVAGQTRGSVLLDRVGATK